MVSRCSLWPSILQHTAGIIGRFMIRPIPSMPMMLAMSQKVSPRLSASSGHPLCCALISKAGGSHTSMQEYFYSAMLDNAHSMLMYCLWCAGDYDYDERDDLPLGCQYSDESSFNSSGALYLPSTFSAGRAPSLAPSPGTAARKHAVVIGSAANDSQAVLRILCKPMPAKTAPLQQGTATQQSNSGGGGGGSKLDGSIIFLICWFGGLGSVLVLCCVAGCLSKGGQAAGGQRGRGGGASGGDAGGGFYWADGGYGGDGGHGGHCDSGGGGCDGGGGGDGGVGGGGGD